MLSFILGAEGRSYAKQNEKFRGNFPNREQ
jgi:hypothetical protein